MGLISRRCGRTLYHLDSNHSSRAKAKGSSRPHVHQAGRYPVSYYLHAGFPYLPGSRSSNYIYSFPHYRPENLILPISFARLGWISALGLIPALLLFHLNQFNLNARIFPTMVLLLGKWINWFRRWLATKIMPDNSDGSGAQPNKAEGGCDNQRLHTHEIISR